MEVDSFLGGRLHVSVPYGTYGGILAADEEVVGALATAAMRLAERRGARVLELRSATALVPGCEPVAGYLGFARNLPEDPNDVGAFLPKRARAAARHARDRDGVVVRHDAAQARLAWDLYCRSMRRLASVNYPYRFFAELLARLGEHAWVSVAWLGQRPVASTISFVFRDTIMPYILGADERTRCTGATNLLYWSVMERAVQLGLRRFDYGRSRADNAGAVGFKKNQGFEGQPLGYQRYVPAGKKPPDLKPSNPRFALARKIWRWLPLPVTRRLGAGLARSIPG
jgi:FemAB-related protein (PEP-CTERM system-associated)